MFDLSFFELVVIGVVALVVIGPEKLPKVARTLGALTGRAQRYVAQVKEEVNREVRFEELQQLQNEIQAGVNKTQTTINNEFNQIKDNIVPVMKSIKANNDEPNKQVILSDDRYEDELYMTTTQSVSEGIQTESIDQSKEKVRRKRTLKSKVTSKVEPT